MEDGNPEAHVQVKVVRSLWCHEGVSERTCEKSNQSPIRQFSLNFNDFMSACRSAPWDDDPHLSLIRHPTHGQKPW